MNVASSRKRIVWIPALIAIAVALGVYEYFHGPKLLPIVPDPIIPPQGIRILPPPGEQPYISGGPDSVWHIEMYSLPDNDTDAVAHFYEEQGFTCLAEEYPHTMRLEEGTEITVVLGCSLSRRASEIFAVDIAKPFEDEGSMVLTKTIVWALFS
jgi:hypothetical protein